MDVVGSEVPIARSESSMSTIGRPRVRRLLLIRHAPTPATRISAFPADEPLDDSGRAAAAQLGALLPRGADLVSSPALRCSQTAEAAGRAPRTDSELRDCDFGSWAGHTLAEIHATDPDAVARWMTDPSAAPHGGETLAAVAARVGKWLDTCSGGHDLTIAITHAEVVKVAVMHALSAPLQAFWQIDVSPLSVTELHAHDGRWMLTRTNCRSWGRS